jgi:peptidoglycan/xylan/chitin deacetylase (PgdA/CDA1 family)
VKLSLTLDNGPHPTTTTQVLDTLEGVGALATFFMVGSRLEKPGARRIAEEVRARGHRIGNHTFSHGQLGDMAPAEAVAEVERTQALLEGLTDDDRLFRPAAGGGIIGPRMMSGAARDHLAAGGYSCVLWNSVPRDWEDADGWPATALGDLRRRDWTVLVLHDLPTGAMAHLAGFLARARDLGAELRQDFPADCVPIWRGERRWEMAMAAPIS